MDLIGKQLHRKHSIIDGSTIISVKSHSKGIICYLSNGYSLSIELDGSLRYSLKELSEFYESRYVFTEKAFLKLLGENIQEN